GTIDGRDVGVFAAKIIEHPDRHAGKTYTPTGPESIDMGSAANALSRVLGKPVTYVAMQLEAAQQAMLGFGISSWFVGNVVVYGRAYTEGWGEYTPREF